MAIFKKSREKIEYILRLKNSNGKDIKTEVEVNCQSLTQPNSIDKPLISESYITGFEKIDGCRVPSYSHLELNTMYYQDPAKIIPIIQMIINWPNSDKKSVNKIKIFTDIIIQNKKLNNSKVTFYLNKCASKLKGTRITQTNKLLNLNLNLESQSTLPYVFAQFVYWEKLK